MHEYSYTKVPKPGKHYIIQPDVCALNCIIHVGETNINECLNISIKYCLFLMNNRNLIISMFSFLLEPAATSSDLPQELEKRPDMYLYVSLPHKDKVGLCLVLNLA